MRLVFALTLVAGISVQQTVKQRITYNLGIWTNAAAHCAEFATEDSVIITEKAEECMRCWAGVGDWATPEGYARGNACLDSYEPAFRDKCGAGMAAWQQAGYNSVTIRDEVDTCWEEAHLRRVAERCAGEDLAMGAVCVVTALTTNMDWARLKVYGEQRPPIIHQLSREEKMVQEVLEEAHCDHANEGNTARRTECGACFDHVRAESDLVWGPGGEIDMVSLRKVFAKYMVCADNYVAPAYTECYKDVNSIITNIQEVNTEEWSKKLLGVQGCVLHKQFRHLFKECEAASEEGAGGLVTYTACARVRAAAWVQEKRPEAADVFSAFLRGGDWMPSNGDLI